MKIIWNWGTGILIGIILFMLFIIGLVYIAVKQDFDLVEKDYYPKALEYQQQIDKEGNARTLAQQIQIENIGGQIILTFQSFFQPKDISGQITFYRPSDKKSDIRFEIEADSSGQQKIAENLLNTGKYILQIDYQVNGKAYYQEGPVYINMY
ncbi:MAG: FixH family protein [Bacteroidetes bacterium]|nr:FixH family protein [Bacteroidota bacterium]